MTNEDILSGKAADGNWTSVAAELEKRFPRSRGEGSGFQARLAEANSLAAQVTIFGLAVPPPGESPPYQAPTRQQCRGGTVTRAFWWGFHVQISHENLVRILESADAINSTVEVIGGNIPSPAQPWIKLLAPFVAAIHNGLREIDRGHGIYISMSWFAPGVFIRTSV